MSGLFGVATSSRPGLATPADDNVHRIADALRLHAYDRTDVTSLASGLAIGGCVETASCPATPGGIPGVWMWLAGEFYRATGEPIDQIARLRSRDDRPGAPRRPPTACSRWPWNE
jgi:hypothetical protein